MRIANTDVASMVERLFVVIHWWSYLVLARLKIKIIMAYHNEDIAACTNDNCPKMLTCLRWQLGTNKDPYQTYLDGSMCEEEFYIENKEK